MENWRLKRHPLTQLHKSCHQETAVQKGLLRTWGGVDGLGLKITSKNGKVLVVDVAGAEQEDLGCREGSDVSLVAIQIYPECPAEAYQGLKRI